VAKASQEESAEKSATDESSDISDENKSKESGGVLLPSMEPTTLTIDREARRMRLLQSPLVEAIDFTAVPAAGRILLRPPAEDTGKEGEEGSPSTVVSLGVPQLRAFIAEVYREKKVDDQRRDKVHQPRRFLHIVIQETLQRRHGVRRVVHQRSWQLIEALLRHAHTDASIGLFTDFLDGSRDLDELSFYLHCSSVLATAVSEEPHALPPTKPPAGNISKQRARRMADLLFSDLPNALEVVTAEIETCRPVFHSVKAVVSEAADPVPSTLVSENDSMVVDDLYRALLEGWRLSALQLDDHVPCFSWRQTILAFIQADVCHRGSLDQHEVQDAEANRLPSLAGSGGKLRVMDQQTSMGAFVCRVVHQCATMAKGTADAKKIVGPIQRSRGRSHKASDKECLEVGITAFESIKKALGVYLTWLMHSEELRDLTVYHSVKTQIYGFHQAVKDNKAMVCVHHFRCLILLLLGHQFDMQLQKGGLPHHQLETELRVLLRLLRESWQSCLSSGLEETQP